MDLVDWNVATRALFVIDCIPYCQHGFVRVYRDSHTVFNSFLLECKRLRDAFDSILLVQMNEVVHIILEIVFIDSRMKHP